MYCVTYSRCTIYTIYSILRRIYIVYILYILHILYVPYILYTCYLVSAATPCARGLTTSPRAHPASPPRRHATQPCRSDPRRARQGLSTTQARETPLIRAKSRTAETLRASQGRGVFGGALGVIDESDLGRLEQFWRGTWREIEGRRESATRDDEVFGAALRDLEWQAALR